MKIANRMSEAEALGLSKEGDLFVWNVVNIPNKTDFYPVAAPREGYDLINALAQEQLKDDGAFGPVESNAFGLVERESESPGYEGSTGFTEWYNEDGQDVDEAFEEVAA